MEKYSAFRDPGTGIQPFLTPVPPQGPETLANILRPFGLFIGSIRTLCVVCVGLVYLTCVEGVCVMLTPFPPVHRLTIRIWTAVLARLTLLFVGVFWIPVEHVTRKRGRGHGVGARWNPEAGDLIISNWISWIEILWLAFRFNPIFVLPVTSPVESTPVLTTASVRSTTRRRTGTGSADISIASPARGPTKRSEILGFNEVSLLSMITATGHLPPYNIPANYHRPSRSLAHIRSHADRPVVVFPECTTSNGRGLLRFADVFKGENVPVKEYNVFIMSVRIDPPTALSPTLALSIPASLDALNPVQHIFSLSSSLVPHNLSIRLLDPSDSPSSKAFLSSEIISGNLGAADILSEASGSLIANIGRMKRLGLGWEDKVTFLDFYIGKKIKT